MIKSLITCTTNKYLLTCLHRNIAFAKATTQTNPRSFAKKPYQVLLGSNIDDLIKFPAPDILKIIRSRVITRLMANNHHLDVIEQVLEAHVECLYELIQRGEPTIEAISMFTDTIYNNIAELSHNGDLVAPIFLNLLNPKVLYKFVKVAYGIEAYYNEAFRSLISLLIIKLLSKSNKNEAQQKIERRKLAEEITLARQGSRVLQDDEGKVVKAQQLEWWEERRGRQIGQQLRYLSEMDYWTGLHYTLSSEYYNDQLLITSINKLEKSLETDPKTLSLAELIIKIKCIVELQRFKDLKSLGRVGLKSLLLSYNKLVDQYFRILAHEPSIIQALYCEQSLVQTQLVTVFLAEEHYVRARKVYLDILRTMLNVSHNGVIMMDVKRLKGVFEVLLIVLTHEDTQEVHALLGQLQRVMMMYPLERFDKLEAHCILAEKYGFKSDFFAEKFLRILLQQKEKLERNRGHMHQIHQSTRELHLAKKFIIYSRLTKPKETIDELVGDLINPNIWPLLSDTEPHLEYYIIASSFGHFLYFIRSGILNITAGNYERRKIEKACLHANIRNNNRLYHQLIDDIRNISVHRNSLTLYHSSNWRQNAHARLLSLLELANYHHANLKRRAPQEASNFIQQFLAKTLGSSLFYNTLKQQLAYPGLLQSFMELMEEASLKNYPIQSRDLEAAKQLYRAQLTNITKGAEKPLFSYLYQQRLEQIEFNRVSIPFNQQVYGLGNLARSAASSLLYQAMRRFQKQKEYLHMQIETFLKFNSSQALEVTTNYLEMPHLADLLVKAGTQCMVVLFQNYQGEPKHFLNVKQLAMQRESENHWKKKGFRVYMIKCQKDLQEFMEKVIKKISK